MLRRVGWRLDEEERNMAVARLIPLRMRYEYAGARPLRTRNKKIYRVAHWPIWIWVFFLAPGPLTFDLFEHGPNGKNMLWLGIVMLGTGIAGVFGQLPGVEPAPYILALRFADSTFDRVIAEAVTMFVDRQRAARELVRVCRPNGMVFATEFFWRQPPTDEAREIFLGQVCPGMQLDKLDGWVRIYKDAGLSAIEVRYGPFEMMTPRGFIKDEGLVNAFACKWRGLSRPSYLRKMAWLMPRISRAVPYLGYILVAGTKPRV